MWEIKKRRSFLAAVIGTCIVSCGTGSEKDRLAVQHTVLRYTQLLAEGYAQMNMTPLQAVATEAQALKVYNHMSALGEAKIRMESHLEDIEFVDVQVTKQDSARVRTIEKWNYTHISTDTKMPSQHVVEGLIYDVDYELVRRDGRWLVSSVSVLEEDRPQSDTAGSQSSLQTKITDVNGHYVCVRLAESAGYIS